MNYNTIRVYSMFFYQGCVRSLIYGNLFNLMSFITTAGGKYTQGGSRQGTFRVANTLKVHETLKVARGVRS